MTLLDTPRPRTTGAPTVARSGAVAVVAPVLRETLLLVTLLAAYSGARLLAVDDVSAAFRHADGVLRLEQWLNLPREQGLQALVLSSDVVVRAANGYYAAAHLPVTGLALLWLFLRHPLHYRWARRALVGATGFALAVYLLLPVAPPRMLPGDGFVDTALAYGQSVYGGSGASSLTNQYAAMPSLHVGWAVLIAVVAIAATRSRWRWLWVLHPVVTLLVVVSTGNHYWLDALAGLAVVAVALVLARRRSPAPAAVVASAPTPVVVPAPAAVVVPAQTAVVAPAPTPVVVPAQTAVVAPTQAPVVVPAQAVRS